MKNSPISSTRKTEKAAFPAACLLLFLLFLLSVAFGASSLTPAEAVRAVFSAPDSSFAARIVWYARIPRALAAMLVGACLAVSGLLIQTVMVNPLASPNIIGVNAGAGLAVVLISAFLPAASGWIPAAAFAGAVIAALAVAGFGQMTGASRLTLVLCGVMLTCLLNAAIDTVLTLVPDALSAYADFRTGSFSGATLNELPRAAIPAAVLLLLILLSADRLETLALGGNTAAGLGMNVRRSRIVYLILASALVGIAVSVCGILGFVGLIAPHISQRIIRGSMRKKLLFCLLTGAVLTLLGDFLARIVLAPYELPAGILLAFAGVPFFLWLLFRQRGGRGHA